MGNDCDAVVAGHICLDIIPILTTAGFAFNPGKLQEVGPAVLSTGGPVSNTGLALYRLGVRTRLMGKVGTDYFGQVVLGIIEEFGAGLAGGMIKVRGEVSSYSLILSPCGTDRMFLHCPGCNDTFGADDVDYDILKSARLLHFGYPPLMRRVSENCGAELVSLLRRAKSTGITTSLDMCMPDPQGYAGTVNWPALISAVLPHVDIYMPSLEETLAMSYPDESRIFAEGQEKFAAALDAGLLARVGNNLLSMGPAVVGLKLGRLGLYLKTGDSKSFERMGRARPSNVSTWANRELWSPCFKAEVVGTTGAGDATIAGFLAALLRDDAPESCVTMGCAVGACNVEAADALSGLRDWDQTQARIRAGWARSTARFNMVGWREEARTGVWRGGSDAAEASPRR